MNERQRELARRRAQRYRARRRAEYQERMRVYAGKRAQSLANDRPDLVAVIDSPKFAEVWQSLYDTPPPEDLRTAHPDVLEYRLECLWEDCQRIGLDLESL